MGYNRDVLNIFYLCYMNEEIKSHDKNLKQILIKAIMLKTGTDSLRLLQYSQDFGFFWWKGSL